MEKQPALKTIPHMVLRDMGPHIFGAALCMLKAKSGAVIHCDLVHEWGDRFTAQGEKGRIVLDHDNVLHITTADGTKIVDTRTWEYLPYIPEDDWNLHGGHVMSSIPLCLNALMRAYESGKPAETSGADNLETIRLVFAAIESFDTGKVVSL